MFQRTWRRGEITVVLLIVGAFTVLASCTTSTLPQDERRAQSIDKSLICPICPGETIDRSQVLLANQMQVIVREQIEEGRSDSEIRQFFADRYGERVLASPPKEGLNLLMWIAPPVGLVLALLVLYVITKSMLRPGPAPALRASGAGGNRDSELDAYLELVDKELGEVDGTTEHPDKDDTEGT